MTSRTSFFDQTIYRKTVRQYWPIWAAYLLINLLFLPMAIRSGLHWMESITAADVQSTVLACATGVVPVITFIFAPLMAMAGFSFLYNTKSCGGYGCLPLKREAIFGSVVAAGLVPILLSNVVVVLAGLVVEASLGCVQFSSLLTWFAVSCLEYISFYGFAVLCAQFTGSILIVPAVYAVLQFTALALETTIRGILGVFLYGLSSGGMTFGWLSPIYRIVTGTSYYATATTADHVALSYGFDGWRTVIVYAVFGIVMLVCALLLNRRRRMETAGDIVAVEPMKPIFKYMMAFGCANVFACVVYFLFPVFPSSTGSGSFAAMLILLLAGGFIGYFGAQMLISKSFRVWRGNWIGFVVFSAVIALLLVGVRMDITGYETRVPAAANVTDVTITGPWATTLQDTANIEEAIRIQKEFVENKDETIAADLSGEGDNTCINFTYTLKNGKIIRRDYCPRYVGKTAASIDAMRDLLNSREGIAERKAAAAITQTDIQWAEISYTVPAEGQRTEKDGYVERTEYKTLSLSPSEAYELYTTCIAPDMEECTIGLVSLTNDGWYDDNFYDCNIDIEISTPADNNMVDNMVDERGNVVAADASVSFYTTPTVWSVRTNEWLLAHGVELRTVAENDALRENNG